MLTNVGVRQNSCGLRCHVHLCCTHPSNPAPGCPLASGKEQSKPGNSDLGGSSRLIWGLHLSHLQSLLWGRGNQRQMRWRLWSWLPQAHMVIVATTHSISQGPGTYQSAVTGWSEVLTASRDIAGQ